MPIKIISAPDATELESKYEKFLADKPNGEIKDIQFQMTREGTRPYYAVMIWWIKEGQ